MSGTDFKKLDAQLDKTGAGVLGMVVSLISRVGIPAAIAFILLTQTNQKLDRLVESMTRLTVVIESKEK
jgi:hypothetical protein